MTAKEFLSQAFHTDQLINSKLEQLMKLRESATGCTAVLSGMPRPDSPNYQSMELTICKIVDLEREINGDIDRLVDLKAAARLAINQLIDPDQRLILELRYLCYKTWPEIMEQLGYSEPTVYRIHGEALKNVVVPENPEALGVK